MASMSSILRINTRIVRGGFGLENIRTYLKMKSPFCTLCFFDGESTTLFSISAANDDISTVPLEFSLVYSDNP